MHQLSTSIYIPNFIEIGKKLFVDGRTDGRTYLLSTDGRSDPPSVNLINGVDLY